MASPLKLTAGITWFRHGASASARGSRSPRPPSARTATRSGSRGQDTNPFCPLSALFGGLWFGYWASGNRDRRDSCACAHRDARDRPDHLLRASSIAGRRCPCWVRPRGSSNPASLPTAARGKPLTIQSALRGFDVLEPREYDGHAGRNPKTGWEPGLPRAASEAS